MANKHIKKCPTSGVIREIQIKTISRYHFSPNRVARIKTTVNSKCWQECGEIEPSYTAARNVKSYRCCGGQFGSS